MKVCLDSRLIKKGEYFVPVKGDNFDGRQYIKEVLAKGAAGIIEVEELYRIAKEKLNKFNPTVIGVAGSVGKSSMRAYLTQILSTRVSVLEGDLNTKLGLSTLIVNDLVDQKVVVAELGIDRIGEMKQVTDFIKPDFSVITKLEKEHLQFLQSLEHVIEENLVSIKNSYSQSGYINQADHHLVADYIKEIKVIFYPEKNPEPEIALAISNLELSKHDKDYLAGIYQICRDKFDFSDREFLTALTNIKKPKGRLNLIEGVNGSLVLDDTYNAVADESIIQGIRYAEELAKKYQKRMTVILSPMRETGKTEEEQHKNVAEFLNSLKDIKLVVIGDDASRYGKYLNIKYDSFGSVDEFSTDIEGNKLYYVKGSQFYRLEKIVYYLMKEKELAKNLLVRQDPRWK